LAKAWFAFIGYSHSALRGGVSYFEGEPEGVYNKIFKSSPAPAFWSAFAETNFTPKEEYFNPQLPSVYQYLVTYGIGKYVDSQRIAFKKNRDSAVIRGIRSGVLSGDPETGRCSNTPKEIDEFLSTDFDYYINIMINNMREVLIELFAFILCRKYVTFDAANVQRMMTFPQEAQYFNKAFDQSVIPTKQQDGESLFGPIYAFLKDCVRQYYFEFQSQIQAAPRLKAYLARRETVNRIRDLVIRRNEAIREYDQHWKMVGLTFLESLPDLPTG
jgi:hypothetical protein